MHGVASHPGFHTGATVEIAAPYAQARFEEGERGGMFRDYPVLVALDMRGLRALTDYDAEMEVRTNIVDVVQGNKIITLDDLEHVCDHLERETPDSALEALFLNHPAIHNPSCALFHYLADLGTVVAHTILSEIRRGKVRPTMLRDVTQQYRYLDFVNTSRITAVGYMKPFWQSLIEWDQGEREERLINAVEALGFDVAGPYDEPQVEITWVYERPVSRNARVEYHGTSYLRLLQAAPELASVLPVPLAPFGTEAPDY
jgi:hypothetical protein